MQDTIQELVNEARKLLANADPVHGAEHSQAVGELALQIAANFGNVDKDAITIAAWWHDVGRKDNEQDHGEKNSSLLKEKLASKGLSKSYIARIARIVAEHSVGKEYNAMSLEGKIFHDADKLDLISPYRWKLAIDHKASELIEGGIERLPKILKQYLILDQSKKIYVQKIKEFKKFIRSDQSEYFSSYKARIVELAL